MNDLYDDDEDDAGQHDSPHWEDPDDGDEVDPEPADEEVLDDFAWAEVPVDDQPPPEGLWSEADWE